MQTFDVHPSIADAERKKREEKARLRAELLRQSGESVEGFVRRRVVGPSTRVLYAKAVDPFLQKLWMRNITFNDLDALDCALEKEMNDAFFQGRSAQDVRVLLYAGRRPRACRLPEQPSRGLRERSQIRPGTA